MLTISNTDSRTLHRLFGGCRACSYWERPELFTGRFTEEEAAAKAEWFEATAASFGVCGKLLCVDGEPAAYCQFAPPRYVPGVSRYPGLMGQLSEDGAFITCLCVREGYQRRGLGRALLADVIRELADRVGVIETIARDGSANNCSGPTEFYLAQGFSVVASESFPDGSSFSLVRRALP